MESHVMRKSHFISTARLFLFKLAPVSNYIANSSANKVKKEEKKKRYPALRIVERISCVSDAGCKVTLLRHFLLWRSHVTRYSKLHVFYNVSGWDSWRRHFVPVCRVDQAHRARLRDCNTDLDRQGCMAGLVACFDEQFLFENVSVRCIV